MLTYDITENTFQTVLQAAVLITTSGRPAAKVAPSHTLSKTVYDQMIAVQFLCPESQYNSTLTRSIRIVVLTN